MAKKKLRRIVVNGKIYYWSFRAGYKKTDDPTNPYRSHDVFVAYAENNSTSPLRIIFTTWEDAIIGGSLRTGATVVFNNSSTSGINLYAPKWAATLIREGLKRGWQAKTKFPFIIENGLELLAELDLKANLTIIIKNYVCIASISINQP